MSATDAEDPSTQADDDRRRAEQWAEMSQRSETELEARLGVTLDGSPDSLVKLWMAVRSRVREDRRPTPVEMLPEWARWPEDQSWGVRWDRESLDLMAFTAAYLGRCAITVVTEPSPEWQVLREPGDCGDTGQVVLVRGGPTRRGGPATWTNPMMRVAIAVVQYLSPMTERQFMPPDVDDPALLRTLYGYLLQDLGAELPAWATPYPRVTPDADWVSTWREDGGRLIPVQLDAPARPRRWQRSSPEFGLVIPEWAEAVLGRQVFDSLERVLAGVEGVVDIEHADKEYFTLHATKDVWRDLGAFERRLQAAVDSVSPPGEDPAWDYVPDRWA